jgi:hypothetical protein
VLKEPNGTKVYKATFSPKDSKGKQNAYCWVPKENALPLQLPSYNATNAWLWKKEEMNQSTRKRTSPPAASMVVRTDSRTQKRPKTQKTKPAKY